MFKIIISSKGNSDYENLTTFILPTLLIIFIAELVLSLELLYFREKEKVLNGKNYFSSL
jgi:hypothetical protein